MSDQINLSIGEAPWHPSSDSRLVVEFNRYDRPTAGVLSQEGCDYLFECLEGVTQSFNIWAYALLGHVETKHLASLSGQPLIEAMERVWQSRDATCALAVEDRILTGALVDTQSIARWGIVRAAAHSISDLLEQERSVSHALKEAAG